MRTVYNCKTAAGDFYVTYSPILKCYTCWFMGGAISPAGDFKSKAEAKRYLLDAARAQLRAHIARLRVQMHLASLDLSKLEKSKV